LSAKDDPLANYRPVDDSCIPKDGAELTPADISAFYAVVPRLGKP
jgi:hypothetical protein